ncbi:MAG: hypothetical protein NTW29_18650 [Bacteroidetes bacterium]|nr:hypothetical protein [Bacteroidota bacterium]
MKIIYCLPVIFTAFQFSFLNSCNNHTNNIEWSENRKLNWDDFKGDYSISESSAAEVAINLKLFYVFDGSLKYDVVCYMIKNQSWTEERSDYALNHEQGHFDIGEIFARRLRKAIHEKSRFTSYSNVRKLDSLELMYHKLLQKEEETYDLETTKPFRNQASQKMWDQKIKKSLDSLKAFTRNPDVKLHWKRKLR